MKQIFGYLLLITLAASALAQAPVTSTRLQSDLRKHIEYLASDKLAGRRTGEPGAAAAAAYVADAFKKLGLRPAVVPTSGGRAVYLQPFPYVVSAAEHKTVTGYNVVGILDGTDKQLKNEAIVIGAHYDHLGRGGEGSLAINSTEIHYGADDNASGTAAVIELAHTFAKERSSKRTLVFIAFSGEEEGLFGSKFYVNNPVVPIENTISMINLDMVGRLYNNKLIVSGTGTASEWKSLVEAKNRGNVAAAAPVTKDARFLGPPERQDAGTERFALAENEDGFGPSDHSSFYLKKIPVLFLFTGPHLDYHKPSDTADKINYAGEERVIAYVSEVIHAIDQNPRRPTYAAAKSSGSTGGRTGFKISLGTMPSYTDSTDGMVIDAVRDDSPAAKAGINAGDKIVGLAGTPIANVQDYTKVLGEMKAGQEYAVVLVRGGQRLTLKIVPAPRP